MAQSRVLVVEDDAAIRRMMARRLAALGCEVTLAEDGIDARGKLAGGKFELVLTDMQMPRADGFSVIQAVREMAPSTQVVMLTAHGSISHAVQALRQGAANFLTKPFSDDELAEVVRDACGTGKAPGGRPAEQPQLGLIGEAPRLREVFELVERIAPSEVTVLLLGETGTGKEVVARLLHGLSPRAGRPFVPLNCGAIPEALMESELFGHTRGAFTGASERRQGKFAAADGGTLFLDEVGELAAPLQVKLLRVLQDQVVTPVGGDEATQKVDVRVIAATNRNLEQRVEAGEFRADLYYRLNVVPIEIPPLRERREDVPILVQSFLDQANRRFTRKVTIDADALTVLEAYRWPGNVRELEHMVERLVVTSKGDRVGAKDLPKHLMAAPAAGAAIANVGTGDELELPEDGIDLPATLLAIERRYIEAALRRTGGNRNQAAQLLKLNRTTLVEKLKRQS